MAKPKAPKPKPKKPVEGTPAGYEHESGAPKPIEGVPAGYES